MHLDEGSTCPHCKSGFLEYVREGDCSCHINPPCSACVDAPLTCLECKETAFEPCTRCNATGQIPVLRNRAGEIDYLAGEDKGEKTECSICSGTGYREG